MEQSYITVSTLAGLNSILEKEKEGQYVYCQEDSQMYVKKENQWDTVIPEGGLKMNLYDINKQIMSQMKPIVLSNKELALIQKLHTNHLNTHYMLLCRELGYYTIFESDPTIQLPTFNAAVADIIGELGELLSMELNEDETAIEIWIKITDTEEAHVFYLFPYQAGVVYFG